jgi:hypothetical protein
MQVLCTEQRGVLDTVLWVLEMYVLIQNISSTCVISGRLHREVEETCALLGYYSTFSGNSSPTFRDNLSVKSSGVKISNKKVSKEDKDFLTPQLGPLVCPVTSVRNRQSTLHNTPEKRRSQKEGFLHCYTLEDETDVIPKRR